MNLCCNSDGGASGDYDEIIAADVGYGAPDSFEGAGDFPLLNEYTRNARESVLNKEDSNENKITTPVEIMLES